MISNLSSNKKALISVFEIAFVFLIFSSSIIYFNKVSNQIEPDYKLTIESSLNSLYYLNETRYIFMNEDLLSSTLTQNWTNISIYLNSSFKNYEFIISNNSISKKIFSCNATYNKYFSEKIIAISNNTNFEFRKIRLGVCY